MPNIGKFLSNLKDRILEGYKINFEEASILLNIKREDIILLINYANFICRHYRKNIIDLCAITNAKSGNCSQDCKFCAQSKLYKTNISTYPIICSDEIVKRAEMAYKNRADRFCIVISGKSATWKEIEIIAEAAKKIKEKFKDLKLDASCGMINKEKAYFLKQAGIERYNHNIETAPSFFNNICTTHSYKDRLNTVMILKEVGLEVCCGGIIGLGEGIKERIEFAFELRRLNVDCVPINFLHPIPNTPLQDMPLIPPLECLKIIAFFRFILPDKEIKVCGGREKNLRSLQAFIFFAGSDGIIIGDYLTTKGAKVEDDLKMIEDLGLEIKRKEI